MIPIADLKKSDPAITRLIAAETKRQQETIDLIASENIASHAVREALGSPLANKYSEGYPQKRYYAGNAVIDDIERLAQERARQAFGLSDDWHVNVQPLSGSPANMAVYFGLLNPGDTILAMGLQFGGHLTHGSPVNFSGRIFRATHYGLTKDGRIDYDEVRAQAIGEKPNLIVAGATAYPRIIDFKKFGEIAREVGSYLMVDMAHIAGLVAGGAHPSPFPHADTVTTTTHKTLRGPRGAIIFAKKTSDAAKKRGVDIAAAIDKSVFPGLQGGPHDNQTAAIAVALNEAMRPAFKKYAQQIVRNARALGETLAKRGVTLVSGGTENHLLLIDLTNLGILGREAQNTLEDVGLIVNRNAIPFDSRPPFNPSGLRIGTPSVTTRGMKEKDMLLIGECIYRALTDPSATNKTKIRNAVRNLCKNFPIDK
ncbi:MAG: serine hydroxymethyltransferase [Patescibacteria group bacterium]